MSNPKVSINLVVHNGEKYIRQCLDSVLAQTYPHKLVEINILDNASTDSTWESIKNYEVRIRNQNGPKFFSLKSEKNLGMWPGQEELLKYSHGEYIVVLSVDVILDKNFVKNAVKVMESDHQIGALQAKIYKYELGSIPTTNYPSTSSGSRAESRDQLPTTTIDTLGFQIFRSRRIVNIGHGELDRGQYDTDTSCFAKDTQDTAKIYYKQIFAVEGAVPFFRRQALEDCRLESQNSVSKPVSKFDFETGFETGEKIVDPDYFWYGDDLDLTWRMRLFGWKQVYVPNVIAWHDRKTTKVLASGWRHFFKSRNLLPKEYLKIRGSVPIFKRRLDWRNTTLTIIKNDFAINWLRDLLYILWRQLQMWIYFLIFEPAMILEIFNVARMLPKMLKRRSEIMKKARVSAEEIHYWFK